MNTLTLDQLLDQTCDMKETNLLEKAESVQEIFYALKKFINNAQLPEERSKLMNILNKFERLKEIVNQVERKHKNPSELYKVIGHLTSSRDALHGIALTQSDINGLRKAIHNAELKVKNVLRDES